MEETPSLRLPGSIFALLILYGVLQARFYASKMPEVMASHFGASGRPNGWQTHSAFFLTELLVVALATLVGFVVPWTIKAIPVSLINLPNKEHWLAPERREVTLAFFRAQFAWMGCALLAFLLFVMELAFRANLATPHQLNNTAFIAGLVIFLVFTTIWSIRFITHFSSGSR
jgi:uncharacterized membrane protein